MLKITLHYLPVRTDVAFLLIKQQYLEIDVWRIAFFIHVFSGFFAFIAGFTQFSSSFLKNYPKVHRLIGKIYVFNILFVTGPSGLIIAFFANGGTSSRIAFVSSATLWIFFTFTAYWKIRKKEFIAHQQFMIRSYALTLSAITLRSWKWLLVLAFAPPPMDLYRWVAWLGFVPNLVIAELLINRMVKKNTGAFGGEDVSVQICKKEKKQVSDF